MHIIPLTRAHLGDCGWMADAAYCQNERFTKWLRPNETAYPDHLKRFFTRHFKGKLTSSNWHLSVMVGDGDGDDAVQDGGRVSVPEGAVVGFAAWSRTWGEGDEEVRRRRTGPGERWSRNESLSDRFERWALGWTDAYHDTLMPDRGYDPEHFAVFMASIKLISTKVVAVMKEHSPTGGFLYLTDLVVDPRYQKRKAGLRLVQEGIDIAEDEGVPIALLASDSGNALYRKLGFVVIGNEKIRAGGHDVMAYWPKGTAPTNLKKFLVTMEDGAVDTEDLVV